MKTLTGVFTLLLCTACSFHFPVAQAQNFKPIQDDKTDAPPVTSGTPSSRAAAASNAAAKTSKEEPADTTIAPEPVAQKGVSISGVVRAVRGYPTTEVFFKDKKDSYLIDPTSSHDQIMNACLQSSRTGQSVSLRVDPVSRHVYSLSEQNKAGSDQSPDKSPDSSKTSRGGAD